MQSRCRNCLFRILVLDSIFSIGYIIWVFIGGDQLPGISTHNCSITTNGSPVVGNQENSDLSSHSRLHDTTKAFEKQQGSRMRDHNCIHIATTADDVFLPGVIGLIKTTYRNSNMNMHSSNVTIQFEIFLTPQQDSGVIKNLFSSKEAKENNCGIIVKNRLG